MRELFKIVRVRVLCIIFIDEFDVIGRVCGGKGYVGLFVCMFIY